MRSIANQFRSVTPILLISYLIIFISQLVIIIVATYKDIPLDTFTQDPTALMNAPFYLGAFSNIGIMFWSASTIICLFTAALMKSRGNHRTDIQYLFVSGFITLLLAFDDMFLLHEEVLPHFQIPENAVIVTYINIFIIYIILFRRKILDSEFIVLFLAFFLLGLSTVIDLLPLPLEKDSFLEDAIKLFGVVSWFIYFWRYCRRLLLAR